MEEPEGPNMEPGGSQNGARGRPNEECSARYAHKFPILHESGPTLQTTLRRVGPGPVPPRSPPRNKSLKEEMKAIKSHQCQFGILPKAKPGTESSEPDRWNVGLV